MAHKASVKIARRTAAKSTAKRKGGLKKASSSNGKAVKRSRKTSSSRTGTKKDAVLALLRRKTGASIDELSKATSWRAHSVRGFLSGTIKKKLGLSLSADKGPKGERRYFLKDAK